MRDVVTDTHALIWYLEDSPRLGQMPESPLRRATAARVSYMSRQSV